MVHVNADANVVAGMDWPATFTSAFTWTMGQEQLTVTFQTAVGVS
jgi:hypothetical protein